MPRIDLDPKNLDQGFDWYGNNAAFTCPKCEQVFLVSAMFDKPGRPCTGCGKSKAFVQGGANSGGSAYIEWEDKS